MKKKYLVLPCEASEGIERLCDPIPRHLYRAGEIVELDDATVDVAGIMARGQIAEYVEPVEVVPEAEPEVPAKGKGDKAD